MYSNAVLKISHFLGGSLGLVVIGGDLCHEFGSQHHILDGHFSHLLKNGPTPASFSVIFGLFKQTLQFLQYVKSVHPVYGAGIRTHDPLICC